MAINRALTACPYCFKKEEVWYEYGVFIPTHIIHCQQCQQPYDANDHFLVLLNLRENTSLSTAELTPVLHKA